MACHLDGGICPHDYPGSSRNGYLGGGSSSYGGGGNYAGLMTYNPLSKISAQYDAAYTAAGNYVSQGTTKNNANSAGKRKEGMKLEYNPNQSEQEENTGRNQEQQFIASDNARPASTIDDTIDEKNLVAVQRNFLEQMIQNARQQLTAQRQPEYMVMYQ